MAILASDLKLLASERMTDLDDGGGYASTVEVLDNADNNVHPDIGSGDRVAGRDWARGLYAGVRTPDSDTLIGGRVYIASFPSDAATSDVLMPAPAYAASRAEAMEEVYYETQLGSNTHLRLKQDVGVGATVLPFYYLSTQTSPVTYIPKVGDRITLKEGSEQQTVLVTGIWTATISGTPTINLLSLTIAPALQHVFHGEYKTANTSEDLSYVSPLQAYFVAAVGAETVGIAKLSAGASIGATTITVDRLSEYVAPQANVITPGLAYPENVAGVYGSKVIITTATAIRTQTVTLPSSGTINRVSYRKNGKWVSLDNVYYGTGTTLVATLPEVPDAGSKIVWSYAGGTTGDTKIVFLLKGPVSTGSLALTAQTVATGAVLSAADNGAGALTGDATGTVDYTAGLVDATWSSAVLLKAVADYTYQESNLEGDADLLGVDLSRAPSGMKAPIFRTQSDVVVHHTLSDTLVNPVVAGATYTLGRSNVDRIWLEDATGTQIPTAKYTANLSAGSVTMAGVLDLSAYTQPLKAYNELRDEAMVIKIEGNVLTLNQALQHAYSATVSFVSSLLRFGDLFASVTAPFSQQAWTSVWSDDLIGSPITPQYDAINYPITVTNQGAITERWRFHFVSTTLVNVIGERVGQIATNVSITGTIAPVNPHTGAPYFSILAGGWGAGWVNGNLLRFNTVSADAMFWALRVTQPSLSPPPATPDRFRLVFLGDVDA